MTTASCPFTDDDDDTTGGTAELDLDVGENTITVTVTAQDATTTNTYTVTVTRAGAASAPDPMQGPQTLVSNIGRPQHASVEVHKAQRRVGIKFTTGDSATAWTLAEVRLQVTTWHPSVTPVVKLRRVSGQWAGIDHCDPDEPLARHGLEGVHRPCGPETSAEHDLRSRGRGRGATGEVQSRNHERQSRGQWCRRGLEHCRHFPGVCVRKLVGFPAIPDGGGAGRRGFERRDAERTDWMVRLDTGRARRVRDVHGPDRIQRSDQHLAGGDAGSRHSGIRRARGDRQARSEERRPVGRQGRSRGRGRSRHHRGGRSRMHRDGRGLHRGWARAGRHARADGAGTPCAFGRGCRSARGHGLGGDLHGDSEPGLLPPGDGGLRDVGRHGAGGRGLYGGLRHADLRGGSRGAVGERAGAR